MKGGVAFDISRMIRQILYVMQTKLTLRLDSNVITRAKRLAKKRGTSVSRLVSDYFKGAAGADRTSAKDDLPPITRALAGSLAGSKLDERDYRRYLEKKYL